MKLSIELVPKSSWYNNVRSQVSKEKWDYLRRETYKESNYQCEICGGKGDKWPVECHEIWHYDDDNCIQKLNGLIALCPDCHRVKHIGFAKIQGKLGQAIKQLNKVNNMTDTQAKNYISQVFEVWRERSKHSWEVDITWLKSKRKARDE